MNALPAGVPSSCSSRLPQLMSVARVATLITLAACIPFKPSGDPAPPPVALTYTIPVTLESRFREDLTVFVLHDGLSSRLTRAGSATTTRFTIPAHMIGSLGEITLIGQGIGGRDGSSSVSSGRLRVLPGQGVVWTVETRLTNSFAQIVPAEAIRPDST